MYPLRSNTTVVIFLSAALLAIKVPTSLAASTFDFFVFTSGVPVDRFVERHLPVF